MRIMNVFSILAILLLFTTVASAQVDAFVNVTRGEYVLILPTGKLINFYVESDGTYKITPIPVSQLGTNNPDDPDTPDDPDVDTNRVEKFTEVAKLIDDVESAKNLMALYGGMAQRSRPPDPLYTTPQQLQENVTTGTDIFLMKSAKAQEWQAFRDVLTEEWVKIAQEGGGMDDYANLLEDASAGLAVASDSDNAVFDITAIFKILEILGDPNKKGWEKIIAILPLIITLFA